MNNAIIGVGIDIINAKRIKNIMDKFNLGFLKKIFTKNEIENYGKIANSKKQILYLAKRFAAKEAFSKACGSGIGRGINFRDIEIANNNLGKPNIVIQNNKTDFLNNIFRCKKFISHLSLSDDGDMAIAHVIIEKIS